MSGPDDTIRWHWDRGMSAGMIADIWELTLDQVLAIVEPPPVSAPETAPQVTA